MFICLLDENNTPYIGLYNNQNVFCHYVSMLQRLHSSPKLNSLLNNPDLHNMIASRVSQLNLTNIDKQTITQFIRDTVEPIREYASLCFNNSLKRCSTAQALVKLPESTERLDTLPESIVHENLKHMLEQYYSQYVSDAGHKGYFNDYNLVYLVIPIIYILFPNQFKNIVCEIGTRSVNYNTLISTVATMLTSDESAFYKHPYCDIEVALYQHMMNNNPWLKSPELDIQFQPFIATTIGVSCSKEDLGGHSIAIVKGKDGKFYIFDDDNSFNTIEEYYDARMHNIYELSLKDIDLKNIIIINGLLGGSLTYDGEDGLVLNDVTDDKPNGAPEGFAARASRWVLRFGYKLKDYYGVNVNFKDSIDLKKSLTEIDNATHAYRSSYMNGGDVYSDDDTFTTTFRVIDDNIYKEGVRMGVVLGIGLALAGAVVLIVIVVIVRRRSLSVPVGTRRVRNKDIMKNVGMKDSHDIVDIHVKV